MLSGDGEAEPNADQAVQLALEFCKEDVISLVIHKLHILGWEVSKEERFQSASFCCVFVLIELCCRQEKICCIAGLSCWNKKLGTLIAVCNTLKNISSCLTVWLYGKYCKDWIFFLFFSWLEYLLIINCLWAAMTTRRLLCIVEVCLGNALNSQVLLSKSIPLWFQSCFCRVEFFFHTVKIGCSAFSGIF